MALFPWWCPLVINLTGSGNEPLWKFINTMRSFHVGMFTSLFLGNKIHKRKAQWQCSVKTKTIKASPGKENKKVQLLREILTQICGWDIMDSLEDCILLLSCYGVATGTATLFPLPSSPLSSECRGSREGQGPIPVSGSSVTPWSLAETDIGKSLGSYSTEVRLWTMEEVLLANTIRILKLTKHAFCIFLLSAYYKLVTLHSSFHFNFK